MIYLQSKLYYLLAIVSCLGLTKRMSEYLKKYFTAGFALIVTLTIMLHPLSIDAFLGPNLFSGVIAFWILLEALFLQREGKALWAILISLIAGIFNIAYSLVPLYFFYKLTNDKKRKFIIPALVYVAFLGLYYYKLTLLSTHNPLSFLSSHLQSIVFPFYINFFTPSLLPFDFQQTLLGGFLLIVILWREEKNKTSRSYWFLIFLPLVGTMINQWTNSYKFWNEVVYSSSTYLSITFAFILMMAIHLPKKVFISYSLLTLIFSYNWASQWNPLSQLMKSSINNLPENYNEIVLVKRTLVWQLFNEEKYIEGKRVLKDLISEFPKNDALKKDLDALK